MTVAPLRILILGAGRMAGQHARSFAHLDDVEVVAVADADAATAKAFADKHEISHAFGTLTDALDWGNFDAVSNVTPDAVHFSTTMLLLGQAKHVLCEKPLATTYEDAHQMAVAADGAGVTHMVNLSYREVPAMRFAARMVSEGAIGEVRHFEASYKQSWLTQPAWGDWRSDPTWLWRLSKAHGSGGALGDVGVHILDFATYVAGQSVHDIGCRLVTYPKAQGDRIGDYVLDANDGFTMQLSLDKGAIGTVNATRFASGHINDLDLQIFGDAGGLEVSLRGGKSSLRACLGADMKTATWRGVHAAPVASNYAEFVAAVLAGRQASPDFKRGAELQRVLDLAVESDAENGQRLSV